MSATDAQTSSREYVFTTRWFELNAKNLWDRLIPQVNPRKILEIGSFEGASACYMIDKLGPNHALELHCVDNWEGGIEHQNRALDMSATEQRFHDNISRAIAASPNPVDLVIHKAYSDQALAKLLTEGKAGYFDFIYVDGSHQAPDVLYDAVVGFKLLRIGGTMAFDDYLWSDQQAKSKDPIRMPKPAIDAFVNLNLRKLQQLNAPSIQLYIQKIAD
ncbi:class I SAM-dependent methyltransferase [Parvibaculum sp.]|uniref:class I SAM-dependent methyltransferase n=1 Tax=Parvibaculum sp. TaxID=2024848 RepID=UPI00320C075A